MRAKKDPCDTKSTNFPKIRVEPWRLLEWRAAWQWMRAQNPDCKVSYSEWVRETLDDEAQGIWEHYGDAPAEYFKARR